MTITPNDILEKKFKSSLRGYNEEQVDEFLDVVKEELEHRIEENDILLKKIMNLEKKTNSGQDKKTSVDSSSDNKKASVIIINAKETADRFISDAKLTAEKIILAANRKSEEMIKDVSVSPNIQSSDIAGVNNLQIGLAAYLEEAKQQAFKILNDAKQNAEAIKGEAKIHADNIINNGEERAKKLYDSTMKDIEEEVKQVEAKYDEEALEKSLADAEGKASKIINDADEKAESTKKIMNIQIANAKQQLESIQNAVMKYKARFDEFINSQADFISDIVTDNIDDVGTGINLEAIDKFKDKILKDSEEVGGLGLDLDEEEQKPVDYEINKIKEDDIEEISEDAQERIEKGEPLTEEEKILKGMDDKYNEILMQISQLEKTKDEVETLSGNLDVRSVNPVVDLTKDNDESASVEKLVTMADEKAIGDITDSISEEDSEESFEEELIEDPSDSVAISDDEKRHLKDMLDEML